MVVADQVVTAVGGNHLVGIDDVFHLPFGMELFIGVVFVIGKCYLHTGSNRFIRSDSVSRFSD